MNIHINSLLAFAKSGRNNAVAISITGYICLVRQIKYCQYFKVSIVNRGKWRGRMAVFLDKYKELSRESKNFSAST